MDNIKISTDSKLTLYSYTFTEFQIAKYLTLNISKKYKHSPITKLSISSPCFKIETGRYIKKILEMSVFIHICNQIFNFRRYFRLYAAIAANAARDLTSYSLLRHKMRLTSSVSFAILRR